MTSLALRLAHTPHASGTGALWDFPDRRPLLYRGRLRRTLQTPPGAEILVRPGQTLESGTVVARHTHRGRATAVDLLAPLGLSSDREDQLLRSLVHQVGEEVVEGDDLARRAVMGGLQRRSVRAPISGRVAHLSVETGTLFIAPDAVQLETRAHLAGTVVEVRDGAVTVEDTALVVAACAGAGPAASGPLRLMEGPDSLPADATGAVVVCTFQVDERTVRAVMDSGAAALVAASVEESTLERLGWDALLWPAENRSRLPSPPLTVLVLALSDAPASVFEALRPLAGRPASALGSAPGAAPELLVSLSENAPSLYGLPQTGDADRAGRLVPGTRVRVLTGKAEGLVGEVVSISHQPYRLHSELSAVVADVAFPFEVYLRLPIYHLQVVTASSAAPPQATSSE